MIHCVEVTDCLRAGHRVRNIWSDKHPLKHSLICLTCTDQTGITSYVAFGVDTRSFGRWGRLTKHAEQFTESIDEDR